MWERITSVHLVGRNSKWEEIPESVEMHEWEEITEPAKVQEWERFPSAGKLQFCEEFAKVRKTMKNSWQLAARSICGMIDSRPSIESRRDLAGREPGRTHGGSGPRGRPSGVPRPLSRPEFHCSWLIASEFSWVCRSPVPFVPLWSISGTSQYHLMVRSTSPQ